MPTLHWIGKDAVINHHKQVPFRLLKCNEKLSVGSPLLSGEGRGGEVGNLLVRGDNLEALKALLPYYVGQVKCIYIDPPYNTGNEGWVYNDNVNSPEIKAWLGKVVGGEAEDIRDRRFWNHLGECYDKVIALIGDAKLVLDFIFAVERKREKSQPVGPGSGRARLEI